MTRTLRIALFVVTCASIASSCGRSKKDGDGGDDTTPPAPGQLLTLTGISTSSAHLAWAASTDDETEPAALEYLAYRSNANDLTTVASIEANGAAIGAYAAGVQEVMATGLEPATPYWFGLIVRDEAGNKAAYTPIPAVTEEGCGGEIPGGCPPADAGHVTVCGRILDMQTGGFFEAAGATGDPCPATPTSSGPCSVTLTAFDALEFMGNPGAASPLVPDEVYVDDCGRYRLENFPEPGLGVFAIVADDAAGTSDRHKTTMVSAPGSLLVPSLAAYVTRNETDAAWTSSAGLLGGSFATQGVAVGLFRYDGAPRSGVTFTRNSATADPDDYYFSDSTEELSTVAPAQAATGSNGAALFVNSDFVAHSGNGGEPPSCSWPSHLMDSVPGIVMVQRFDAELTGGGVCP